MNRNIRAEMVRHDLTTENLATVLEISAVSVLNKIKGKTPWTLPEAKRVVDYFNSLGGRHTIESLYYDTPAKASSL